MHTGNSSDYVRPKVNTAVLLQEAGVPMFYDSRLWHPGGREPRVCPGFRTERFIHVPKSTDSRLKG